MASAFNQQQSDPQLIVKLSTVFSEKKALGWSVLFMDWCDRQIRLRCTPRCNSKLAFEVQGTPAVNLSFGLKL